MPPKAAKLGILAGGGELPRLLIETCQNSGREVFVIAFKSQCDPETTQNVEHAWVNIGKAGAAIEQLRAHGVEELVMAGRIQRPSMAQLMPDARALKIIGAGVMNKGDDSLLSTIVHALETEEGFHFVGVHEVMPELLAPEGVLGRIHPSEQQQIAIRLAIHAAKDLGAKDLGQAAVASALGVIALEERAGTDAMLESLLGAAQAQGAVLAKMMKPGQERRADLPTIGVHTVENAARAGLGGIVVEAAGALILNRAAVVKAADAQGLFVMGVTQNA